VMLLNGVLGVKKTSWETQQMRSGQGQGPGQDC
jgi:hypothetical protein